MSPVPLSAPNSVPSPHAAGLLRPTGSSINPVSQSKLAGSNGTSTVKMGGFGQGSGMQSSQENSQDKQAEQAKLVRSWLKETHEYKGIVYLQMLLCF